MGILYVCNNGKKDFTDRYDGEEYVFAVGETVAVSADAARHIFGYGEGDKSRAMRRQGVVQHSSDGHKAQEWLGQFAFEELEPPPPPNLAAKRPVPKASRNVDDADVTPAPVANRKQRMEPIPPHGAV